MRPWLFLLWVLGSGWVSQARAVEPRELLEVADFSAPVISPDGRQVAFRIEQASIERNTFDASWYVQGLDGGAPRRVADGGTVLRGTAGTPLPASVSWSPDGQWIYYRALVDGRVDVWRASTRGAGAVALTHDASDVRAFALVDGGRTLRYSVGPDRQAVLDAEQAESERGVRIDPSVPLGQGLVRSGNVDGRLATQRYGKVWFDRASLLADVPDVWKAMDLASGKVHSLAAGVVVPERDDADPDKAFTEAWKVSRDMDGRAAILTRFGEKHGLQLAPSVRLSALLQGRGERERVCADPLCTDKQISLVQWRPGHDEVVFTVSDPDAGRSQSIFRWDVRTDVVFEVAHAPGLLNGGRDGASKCGIAQAVLVCVSASANQPPRLEAIDLETGAARVLYEPNAALAQAMSGSAVRLLRWRDAAGRVFTGQYYPATPIGGAPAPLFVSYYLCTGFVRGGVGDEWPFASLAAHGIAALCINSQPYRIEPVERYDEALSAVDSVVKLLSADGQIDAGRVGMGGLSFGSEVTMWTAMRSKLLTAASVSSPSVTSTYYLFGSMKGAEFRDGLKELWGLESPQATPERWRQLSPQYAIDQIQIPVLFQMPEQEYLYALDYAIPLLEQGRAELYAFPNEPHQKFQPRHKLAVYQRNLDWFRFWLQGVEDPDPGKDAQYAGWRKMRLHLGEPAPARTAMAGP
ncbi:Dipeptidyl aminopeptidase/acylaminoacyl peptidase [Pseudoxanthomonas sp. GM95]|uniref:Atxe2 family lasso peptide isopeptidase n=1 Tax=Pseudoxanthomonas sp. GM95 TaxID=1881043 RepID=UPI0008BFCDCA|nr:Atxe2 family lasso peptide isopeptidase [Pseudoxanthomonas sp. GM95]SEM51693.1 Dipeptidyl aminopeptidase/acylaminoacyl peptidase [Pseudoxanthomonas sp. GM95]